MMNPRMKSASRKRDRNSSWILSRPARKRWECYQMCHPMSCTSHMCTCRDNWRHSWSETAQYISSDSILLLLYSPAESAWSLTNGVASWISTEWKPVDSDSQLLWTMEQMVKGACLGSPKHSKLWKPSPAVCSESNYSTVDSPGLGIIKGVQHSLPSSSAKD